MCVVSMIMDHYDDSWRGKYIPKKPSDPWILPKPTPAKPVNFPTEEEIAEFRKLLERAREYDRRNNEPDCELQEKREKLLKLAKELGIEINFL